MIISLIFTIAIGLVAYTIHILSVVSVKENEIPKLSWSPEYGYGYIDLPIRYFKGGPWNSRNSWSNTPNGERGATIPDKYTIVHIIGDKDCLMDYSKFKRWMHRDFWFEDLPPIQIFSLIINL